MLPNPAERSRWRAVAVPSEHGGWGLTLEPVLLGLLVASSVAGALIGLGALVGFLARTPLKLVLVDNRRGRYLARTATARRVLSIEVAVLILCAVGAAALGDPRLWLPVIGAGPLVAVELWFDVRSRSRRLTPELAGAVGVSAVAAVIVLAAGEPMALAGALWMILAARALTTIPFVRDQVSLLHGRPTAPGMVAAGDITALVVAVGAGLLETGVVAGSATVAAIVVFQRVTGRNPPPTAVVLGVRQTVIGLTLVLITGLGVLAP